MFGLNWGEVVVIGIVALIAIGPKELPTVLRTLGQWTGKMRRMANEFQGQFQEALREAELSDLQKHADDLSSSVSDLANIDPLADVQKDLERTAADVEKMPDENVSEPAALAQEEPPAALPDISEPVPELPPPAEKDFASAEPAPASPAKAENQAGGGA